MGRVSLSWAHFSPPSQTLRLPQRRRSDRNEGSVKSHVTMTAEAKTLSQKDPQELYLK